MALTGNGKSKEKAKEKSPIQVSSVYNTLFRSEFKAELDVYSFIYVGTPIFLIVSVYYNHIF